MVAAGNILIGNTLRMASKQKTFSVAISREMSPIARVVAYCVWAGEVVVDSLAFHVYDTRLSTVSIYSTMYKITSIFSVSSAMSATL